jgi:hypothetical protein
MGERHKGNNGGVLTDYIETNIQERKKERKKIPKGSTRANNVYLRPW